MIYGSVFERLLVITALVEDGHVLMGAFGEPLDYSTYSRQY